VIGLRRVLDMERECKFGKMVQNMKAIGRMIWRMGRGDLFILMVMFMREIGSMIKLTEEACIFIWMERDIQVIGEKTSNMVME
jgi:hypothetical protein